MRRVLAITLTCAAASVAATWLLLECPGTSTRRVSAPSTTGAPAPTSETDRGASVAERRDWSRATVASAPTTSEPIVRARHEDGESSVTLRWKELAPAERLRILEDDFETAVGALEEPGLDEREQADAQRTAEASLSAMRAELYDSERGRALHQRYEARLERAVEARAPGGG